MWTESVCLKIGASGGEHVNEPSGSIRGGKFLDFLRDD